MRWRHYKPVVIVVLIGLLACVAAYAKKGKEKGKQLASPQAAEEQEVERQVTEAAVPAAALAALKKLAGGGNDVGGF